MKRAFSVTGLALVIMGVVFYHLSGTIFQSTIGAMLGSLTSVVTCIFRTMCFNDLPGITDKLSKLIVALWKYLYSWFEKER